MYEKGITKQKIIAELTRSPHGKLNEYLQVGIPAVNQDPSFVSHLIAWDAIKGQVRDAKVALPVVMLRQYGINKDDELLDNAFAHLAKLGPRELLRAFKFGLEIRLPTRMRRLRALLSLYLRNLESEGHWQRVALQHRRTLQELYRVTHTKPASIVDEILFKNDYPKGSIFETVAQLKNMSNVEAAGTIMERKIPFLIALGALGSKVKDPDLVLALIQRMTPTELVTNMKMLERLGVKTNPALRGALEVALGSAAKGKTNVLKTTRAAEQMDDQGLKDKLRGVQEKQLSTMQVEGNWLVLADKSGSMQQSIEASRHIAATLAKLVKGKVWLVFFDTMPLSIDVTGCSLDVIKAASQHIRADGGTSIGCGLLRMLESKEEVDGIAIVSDGCENQMPHFWPTYKRYSDEFGKEVPVYLYRLQGTDYESSYTMFKNGGDVHEFDIRHNTDYYSLPNLVSTMRTNRYSLVDEIMSTKLLTLKDVLTKVDTTHFLRKEVGRNVTA
jgi:hypothetical protein